MTSPDAPGSLSLRELVVGAVAQLDHVLPGQAPILNFVHHNTLHGFQHLPFTEALAEAERLTGIRGYLPDADFRRFHQSGRIDDTDIEAALNAIDDVDLDQVLATVGERPIIRREVWRIALVYGIDALSPENLQWRIDHRDVLNRFQEDIPYAARSRLLDSTGINAAARTGNEATAIADLWEVCLARLGLDETAHHPEEPAEALCSPRQGTAPDAVQGDHAFQADPRVFALFEEVGAGLSLRGLLQALTGIDILDDIRPRLIRLCASHLDEGLAAWHAPDRERGLYTSWRHSADRDPRLGLTAMPEVAWRLRTDLPEDSADAVVALLQRSGIPQERWTGYLERLALEIPGWSGMFNWRAHRPHYSANRQSPASLMDYLALRLFFDSLWLERLCRETWGLGGRLDEVQAYARRNPAELSVRRALFAGELPEHLATAARQLLNETRGEHGRREQWRALAGQIHAWQDDAETSAAHGGWRLFRLAQHLGIGAAPLRGLSRRDCEGLLAAVDELTAPRRGYLWLCAYERHYRDALFAALSQNHGRGRWARREERPSAQVIFCMDDREESIRRHLEALDPDIETLGAAGFFGVAMNWRGLDDEEITPLCPVVVTPVHQVSELPRPGEEPRRAAHDRRRKLSGWMSRVFHQELRRNLLSSGALVDLLAPAVLPALLAKVFLPRQQATLSKAVRAAWTPAVPTRLDLTAEPQSPPAPPEQPRRGFTDDEQADRVAAFLRNVGLTNGFAPLVVLAGHGSISQNNPHLAAYDCGACSGRHGGPNARAFAAMANRREVREKVTERGIVIPPDTWFLGTEHNTCDETMLWFDLDDLPHAFESDLEKLRAFLDQAVLRSAHERCRRFASAPRAPSPQQALRHVVGRAGDFSQARPELGHATNAAAVIGRRAVTHGAFLDRRVFLISYDPSGDPEGSLLEGILLAAGPVGAGINLEYYFSTVHNERFGCGSKVPHNVTGLFGVMEGASSDLRTGLPRQMVEIHEAMRLQVVVEAREEILAAIYQRQPALRELIGNGWILLSAIHPDTGAISVFDPRHGFIPWKDTAEPLPMVASSAEWYAGYSDPRPPALLAVANGKESAHAG